MFYTDKYYLLHQFKLYTGYTIHQYVQQKRLITAKLLLKEGKSAMEACEESGFGDYANFIRAFKKAFGVPPGRYRKTNFI
jgi:AraC-like DNA-binding protein